ncbi:hypothetical protein GCM10009117_14750 [Gangjinia marincola]|uniref:SusE outer membrane protein domain-containing protein n=1 Tax=Gangjinia marincola TaxID=578463 RepID=A0ABN1MHF9_9FLAO
MKKYLYLLTILSLLVIVGCEEEATPEFEEDQQVFVINDAGLSSVGLNFSIPQNPAFTLTWQDNLTGSSSYDVEFALTEDFEETATLRTTAEQSFTISVAELNSFLLDQGAVPFQSFPFFLRIVAENDITTENIQYSAITYVDGVNPQFTSISNDTELTLVEDLAEEDVATVTWSDFDNEASVVNVDYVLEAAFAGTDFETVLVAGTTTSDADGDEDDDIENQITWTHEEVNNLANALGVTLGETTMVDLRIKSSLISNNAELVRYSDPVTITVNTYEPTPAGEGPYLFLVGAATAPGWDNNNNNPPVFRNADDSFSYTYTGYFEADAFKMLEERGQWQPQWGTNDGSTLAVNPGDTSDPDVFSVATAGYKTFQVDIVGDSGTFSITDFDASGSPDYTSPGIGLIGSSTPNGWDDDTPMTQSTFDSHLWYITDVVLVDGEAKFRTVGNWDINWGADTSFYGQGTQNGSNIPVTAGTYDVWFNDLDGRYVFILID